jgi:hypothetical protein
VEWRPVTAQPPPEHPSQAVEVAYLDKEQAEQLLDWLEAQGVEHREVSYDPEHGFIVRYC